MKKHGCILIFLFLSICIFFYWFNQKETTLNKFSFDSKILVAVLMVKNEEHAMIPTLQPLIKSGITQYLIYDTGSTDNTIAITQEFFAKNNIKNYAIEQGPWVDFSTSRNKALELTEYHFPCATFILMLDAEWILHHGDQLLTYCQQQKNHKESVYLIQMKGSNLQMGQLRLLRTKSGVQFVGKVHEQPNQPVQAIVPDPIYLELSPTRQGKEKSRQRWLQDLNVLLPEVKRDPTNARTVRFLAQTYLALEDFENAVIWYKKLTQMPIDSNEDLFAAHYYLSMVYQAAQQTDDAIHAYLNAFEIRPIRAEPLIRLALLYYQQQDYALAYLFSKHAVTMPYPNQEIGVIEKILYDFVRYETLALTAQLFQDYELGYQATIEALKVHPELEHLQKLLQFYKSKLQA